MLTYLCCICDNLYFISLLICIGTGAHIFITNIMNIVSATCIYEENRKQMVIPKIEKVLFIIFLMVSIFLPNNLRHNVIDKLQEDLSQQRQQVIQANEQITTFNLYLQKTDQVEQWTDFYNKFNN